MEELVKKIDELYVEFAKDAAAQVTKGNKAAGLRARKASLELGKLLKEFRTVSNEAANA
ncbi:MAG: histone H1 [Bacteroidales bacterium]|nr:histone H1 [Candidatus Liminaster caballi]